MKPAILVALLFRTLDAFRIFDTVFILNGGTHNTETVSILGYNQLLNRLNLGLGSTVSVLVFLLVAIIAAIFIKGLRRLGGPGGVERTDDERAREAGYRLGRRDRGRGRDLARAGPVDRLAVVQGPATITDGRFIPKKVDLVELLFDLPPEPVHRRAAQLDRHRADLDADRGRDRLDGGLRDLQARVPPGSGGSSARRSRSRCSRDLDRRPALQHVAQPRPLRHVAGADHPPT